MSSPTQRSLEKMRKEGWVCQVTEHYNSFSRRRVDLFGFLDIVCLRGSNGGILGIQTTTGDHLSERIKKTQALPDHKLWLESGGGIELHGWSKKGKAGKRKLWQVRVVEL